VNSVVLFHLSCLSSHYRPRHNEPSTLPYVAAKVAEAWGCSVEEVGRVTTENALRFFNWK
jgi:TatD DNase family protein